MQHPMFSERTVRILTRKGVKLILTRTFFQSLSNSLTGFQRTFTVLTLNLVHKVRGGITRKVVQFTGDFGNTGISRLEGRNEQRQSNNTNLLMNLTSFRRSFCRCSIVVQLTGSRRWDHSSLRTDVHIVGKYRDRPKISQKDYRKRKFPNSLLKVRIPFVQKIYTNVQDTPQYSQKCRHYTQTGKYIR